MPETCTAEMPLAEVKAPQSHACILGGFSFALDLASSNPEGHTLRTCMIGMKLGKRIGLEPKQMNDLFYALLLKDIGITGEVAEALRFRHGAGLEASLLWRAGLGGMPRRRILRAIRSLQRVNPTWRGNNELLRTFLALKAQRWQHTAEIARNISSRILSLGLNPAIAEIIQNVGARWDGRGHPRTRPRRGIPVLSQIIKISQTLDILHSIYGGKKAIELIHRRYKGWFDPGLVAAVTLIFHSEEKWSEMCTANILEQTVRYAPVESQANLSDEEVDRICQVFATIVDSYAHNTSGHSVGVAHICERIAEILTLPAGDRKHLRRSAWLHDLGLLGVKISLLDKAGPLTDAEQAVMQRAPLDTYSILQRIPGFTGIATIAAAHHERLDGSGYPLNLQNTSIPLAARILAVADVAEALAAARSYRPRLNSQEICDVMDTLTPHALDARCVHALREPAVLECVA